MKKILSLFIIVSLIFTAAPVYAYGTSDADYTKNTITMPTKIKPGKKLIFSAQGDRQNELGTIDDETRYVPFSYDIEGPNYYYSYGFYNNSIFSKSRTLKVPGKYRITVEFNKEIYYQNINTWSPSDEYVESFKIVTVTKPIYKITLNANKGKIGKKTKTKKKVTYWNKYGKLKTPKRSGYKFKGWYTKKSGGKKITKSTKVKKLKAHTLYAHWKKIESSKKSSASGSGTYVYITNTGTKYHKSSCRYLSKSKIKILKSKAKSQGYSACSICKP